MRISKYIFVGLALFNGAVYANTLTLNALPGNAPKDSSGNFISPYAGTLVYNGVSSNLQFSCDDFTHNIATGTTYNAVTLSTLTTNFSNTLFGSRVGQTINGALFTATAATTLYQEVFYLSSLEAAAIAASNITTAGVIQDAIWTLTNTYEPNNATHSDPPSTGTAAYISQAAANYNNYTYQNFVVVDAGGAGGGGVQELFYSTGGGLTAVATPEPGTLALLAGGLAAVGLHRRRRTWKS